MKRHLGHVAPGTPLRFGVRDLDRFESKIKLAGFCWPPALGETRLPARAFGPVSRYNAEGKWLIHKDQPKETAYRQVMWTWTECHGPDRVEKSDIRDVPYQRYPRTHIGPPSIELSITNGPAGGLVLVSPALTYDEANENTIRHTINLLLEMFRECEVFGDGLAVMAHVPLRRLNWRILPPGERPWEQLKIDIEPMMRKLPEGVQKVVASRLETVSQYHPAFTAVGEAGFRGYVVFAFPEDNLYLLECLYWGNATYVFEEDWERLSKMTKAEILDQQLQKDRLIHRKPWPEQVRQLLGHRKNGATKPK